MGGVLARRPDLFRAHLEEGLRLVADGTLRVETEEIGWGGVVKAHELLEGRVATVKYVLRTA